MDVNQKAPLFEEMTVEETDAVQGGIFTLVALGQPIISVLPGFTTGITFGVPGFLQITF